MKTEVEFSLPRGYVDEQGQVYTQGRMRLALAIDEVETMNDERVQVNESYLPILLLSRVITALGSITAVTPTHIEHLFASDLAYLQELYLRLNSGERVVVGAVCPTCHTAFQVQTAPLGDPSG
ncbi:MAG: phage tail assembly protein [Chloroflexota bacterium]|jgi:hypothetical protein